MQTRQALVLRALRILGVPGAGQTPSADDNSAVDPEIEPLMADLASRGIWQWGDPDQIADDAFVHLARLLANSVAMDFGKAQDEAVRLLAEQRLRELKPVVLSGQRQRTEYY